jgi:hypothetical protein
MGKAFWDRSRGGFRIRNENDEYSCNVMLDWVGIFLNGNTDQNLFLIKLSLSHCAPNAEDKGAGRTRARDAIFKSPAHLIHFLNNYVLK